MANRGLYSLLLIATLFVVVAVSSPLSAHIEVDEAALAKGAFVIRAIFTRSENEHRDISVLTWDSPLDNSFGARNFVVKREGEDESIQYIGPVAKRLWSTLHDSEHYVTFNAANPTNEIFVRLDRDFDLGKAGSFEVTLSGKFYHHKISGEEETELNSFETESNTIIVHWNSSLNEFEEEEELSRSRKLYHLNQHKRAVVAAFDSCSASQQTTSNKALTESGNMADAMLADANSASSKAHQTFFGIGPSSASEVVKTVKNIRGAQSGAQIVLFCKPDKCQSGVIAYVYPVYPLDVYLCATYWQLATVGGYDTQAGSLIHELSHFTVVGGTQDYVYGPPGAQSLALRDSTKAQKNADNFEYYGESIYPTRVV